MNKKLDNLLYDALKPANDPAPELNRRILDRKVSKMRKFNVRKTAVAAAIGILVAAGGVSVYAATQHHSLLSIFKGEDSEVQQKAGQFLDTKVAQETGSNKKQSQWATFKVREAIADKNVVRVQVEVKAVEPDKYLLVPYIGVPEEMSVENLHMEGLTGEQTLADYAKSLGKKCLPVEPRVAVPIETCRHHMEKDGTLLFDIELDNNSKSENLEYVCETIVSPDGKEDTEIKDQFSFTLTDKTEMETFRYLPVSDGKVAGTNLVVDEVVIEKSDLEAMFTVTYHYAGNNPKWTETSEFDIDFYLVDSAGKIIESGDGYMNVNPDDDTICVSKCQYSLKKLPDDIFEREGDKQSTIIIQGKDVMEKELSGKVELKLAE
ncbi:MAG: DUF4179 domain-containing protein [Lachnospiraceae bacterium]|nr:DUF4179 domain-containing protein [Lachnospiraceae bacterium]